MCAFACILFMSYDRADALLQCYDCHGSRTEQDNRPADAPFRNISTGAFPGSHRTHLPFPSTAAECATCHPGSQSYTASHRNGSIKISASINNSPQVTTYRNQTSSFFQTPEPLLDSCRNINCHFETVTPVWGSATLTQTDCGVCHGFPPADGSHGKKHGSYYGVDSASCTRCHSDHATEADPLVHALEAGKRPLQVQFSTHPNSGGHYSGTISYPEYLPSQSSSRNGSCTDLYCHSDGNGRNARITPTWSGQTTKCYSCHGGRTLDNNEADCNNDGGIWNQGTGLCSPFLSITTNGHNKLVGPQWIRQYPCYYCHNGTTDNFGNIKELSMHVNKVKNVEIAPQWAIVGRAAPYYNPADGTCYNVYCHSDGTTDPDTVKPYRWTDKATECNSCHGHAAGTCSTSGCHDGHVDSLGNVWTVKTAWPLGQEWKAAIPMFPNQGPGTPRANSHTRHARSDYTCDECHAATIKSSNGSSTCIGSGCHVSGQPLPTGKMSEIPHLNALFHANKAKDVVLKRGGSYDPINKTCSNSACHTGGTDPQWGGSVNSAVVCVSCHGTTSEDVDSFSFANFSTPARINLAQWATSGHGRPLSAGPYPVSNNPPANFPGNPCWYCHDNNVLHNDSANPFRLRQHNQFDNRFSKECVYCHMERKADASECLECHVNQTESLAPQATASGIVVRSADGSYVTQYPNHRYTANCINGVDGAITCHTGDSGTFPSGAHLGHNSDAGVWSAEQKNDIRNQYVMMGVCLKCHDDDSGDKCSSCHTAPAGNPLKYSLGFRPWSSAEYRFIKPEKARATSVHFGYKHNNGYKKDGIWRGGKFCWDCHDPHGDANIYMIQNKVATTTDGTFGIPRTRAAVSFTRKQSGLDYARINAPFDGICNVCHSANSKHYRNNSGDGHNASRVCTTCHEHRFSDSHADKQACTTCHKNKPVPRHTAFGLPRNCTKCHAGTINKRMDVMGQMKANSHHVQGVDVTAKHCYACHWESTPEGLIDVQHHEGYNYKLYTSVKNARVDLVVWKPGVRPTYYNSTTAVQFTASRIGTAEERTEVGKLNNVCLGCHSDQNNKTDPFGDCKTPRQYAWDGQSVAARYSQNGTTPWGKYNSATYTNANRKDTLVKAFSAHGNAVNNQGGFSPTTGIDSAITSTRAGSQNVQCFDCHSSHGSKVNGTTTSYVTFNGTRNGGNLKETQAGKGGYAMSYKASANTTPGAVNPYNAGAGQCFDCHMSQNAGTTPWGYQSTFGASAPILGYFDSPSFGQANASTMLRYAYKQRTIKGGHMKASSFLNHSTSAHNKIYGLCTPCHDPHGVTPTLGSKQAYAVPMLKGTWLTTPYKEDVAPVNQSNRPGGMPSVYTDQNTFNGSRITETDDQFAGLCLRCHSKGNLTNGTDHTWKSQDRIHEAVKGWKTANGTIQHNYTCSKCHVPHTSGLPRLMHTDCLSFKHRGRVASALGNPGSGYGDESAGGYPRGENGVYQSNCHPTGTWPDNSWNMVTPW